MKWILLLLVLCGLGFGVYHYQDQIKSAIADMTGDGEQGGGGDGGGEQGGGGAADGGGGASSPPPGSRRARLEAEIEKRYPMPDFKPVETYVDNWRNVPPTSKIFPRTIVANVPVTFKVGAGSSQVAAGKEVLALSLTGGQVLVAPAPGSTQRGQVAVEDTNLKEVVTKLYDDFKERRTKEVLERRERELNLAMNEPDRPAASPSGSPATGAADRVPEENLLKEYESRIGKMPERDSSGRVAIMVRSIEANEVNDFEVEDVKFWGPVRYQMVDGQPYWTGTVNYTTVTLFGSHDTEAMALMRNGQVESWVFTGSMQIVP